MRTIILLTISNVFMTFAWYGHLKYRNVPLWKVAIASWGIAFFEYRFQVPANRTGSYEFTSAQLKTIQEVITLTVFSVFSITYLGDRFSMELRRGLLFHYRGRFLRVSPVVESMVARKCNPPTACEIQHLCGLSGRQEHTKRRHPCNAKLPQFGRAT